MIAPNIAEEIHESIARKIAVTSRDGGRFSVDIPLAFPDGDQCRVYVSKTESGWVASDGGASVMRAAYAADVDVLGRGHRDRLRQVLELYGLAENHGQLEAIDEDLGNAVFNIAQASLDIVHLATLPREQRRAREKQFAKKLAAIVTGVSGSVTERWHDESRDPDALYPVTYRIDKKESWPLFVFGASTANKCLHATMSCLFHRQNRQRQFLSIAIYDAPDKIPQSDVRRLDQEVDRSFRSIDEHDEIVAYIEQAA